MKVEEIDITKVKAYEKNPRKNEPAVDAVARSLQEFGWKQPLVVDPSTMEIIVGHTRWKAAKKLGMTTVPCLMADDLTEEQIKAYRLADNKTNELAEWDFDLLDEELSNILDIDMTDFGFDFDTGGDISNTEAEEDDFDAEAEYKNIIEPVAKLGDVWQLGRHRLVCGDSTDKATVQKLMNGELADLLLTDPPYNVNYEGETKDKLKIQNDNMTNDAFSAFLVKAFENAKAIMKDGASFYIWHADSNGGIFRNACASVGLTVRQCLIWLKNSLVLGRQDYQWKHEPCLYGWKDGAAHYWGADRKQTTILEFDRPQRNAEHPTMKPVKMFDYLICNSSKKGGIVADLFLGSGTTLIACEQDARTCYGIEFDRKYCDVIIKRWEMLTGQKAVLLSG